MAGHAFGREILAERPICLRPGEVARRNDQRRQSEEGATEGAHGGNHYSTLGAVPVSGVTSIARARPMILASPSAQPDMHGCFCQNSFSVVSRSSSMKFGWFGSLIEVKFRSFSSNLSSVTMSLRYST